MVNPNDPLAEESLHDAVLRDDTNFASNKIAFCQYVSVAVFLFLISGFWRLQVQNNEFYSEAADRNRIKSTPMIAPRGKILDRDGRVIVDNHSSFSVYMSLESIREEHLPAIAAGINLGLDELLVRLKRFKGGPKYQAVVIKDELTPAEISFVASHNDPDTFPELELVHVQHRLYPRDNLLSHVIGYVGEVTETELENADFAQYNQGDVIGKAGIERQYNETLMGIDGQRQVVVDNKGNARDVMGYTDAVPGRSLQLTVDLDLQVVAEMAMEGKKGSVVALDPRTGEVLAMVSRPAFDPNKFAGRIRQKDWDELFNNPDKPMLNRAIQANLAPGSTFKPLMALAGLELGVIDEHTTYHCSGGMSFFGHYHRCHARGGHGTVDLHRALAQSCDVYFYNVGNKLGIDNIAKFGEYAGLGSTTGIDLPYEYKGILPSTKWKTRTQHQPWFAGETISVSIGQGALAVTPLQLAVMTSGIASGGVWQKPHLVKDAPKAEPRRANVNMDNVNQVIYGMYGVVNQGGTATVARIPGIDVCGKTGTAQLASNELLRRSSKLASTMKDNAWFVAFAPRQNPEVVVAVLFENGEHGPAAAPIARDVLKSYFDKKARNAQRLPVLALAPLGQKGFAN